MYKPKEIDPIAIDFETLPIQDGSGKPPEPIGFAVHHPDIFPDGEYFAFGHTSGNNCCFLTAQKEFLELWAWPGGFIFHNAAFDIAVAEHWFKAPRLKPELYHDTMILAFLHDPNSPGIDLKGLGEKILHMPKDEQDAVKDYLFEHKDSFNPKLSAAKKSDNYFMKFLKHAPGALVGEYAIGDVVRTYKLYNYFTNYVAEYNMQDAYFLEIETMLLLMEMRYTGIRIDLEALSNDIVKYNALLVKIDAWFYEYFGEEVNLNASPQIVKALLAKGEIKEDDLLLTKTGKLSGSAESLEKALPKNNVFSSMFGYRQKLTKYLSTFMLPWETMALRHGGIVYSNWHQVKNASESKVNGTRTGRLSSSIPNLQNIPRTAHKSFFKDEEHQDLPECPLEETLDLPQIRRYVVPFKPGHVLISIDYSQQELRILAHYEDAKLLDAYKKDPNLDVHTFVREMVNRKSKLELSRNPIKAVNFGIAYGQGVAGLAAKLGISKDSAQKIIAAYFKAFPDVRKMLDNMKYTAESGKPFKTMGGRVYFGEPPKKNGDSQSYKASNTIIQGSAADMSKRAIVEYNKIKHKEVIILLQVHDEFLLSCPESLAKQEHDKLQTCMESYPCDCPLIANGVHDKETWADCK